MSNDEVVNVDLAVHAFRSAAFDLAECLRDESRQGYVLANWHLVANAMSDVTGALGKTIVVRRVLEAAE